MTRIAAPAIAQLQAPASWGVVDIVSDLHLQPADMHTFEAWRRYMRETPADAVFILGDLFEVWIGDDAALQPGFQSDCAAVLKSAAGRAALFLMHGNRDFLVGERFVDDCGATLLQDPTVLAFQRRRWLLTHGDALCVADTDYMVFRGQVRAPGWQREFLARPLPERQEIAARLRAQSEDLKRTSADYSDVDAEAALGWMEAADADILIHGHTHRPADHLLGERLRIVLSDWDAAATPRRAEALRLTKAGAHRVQVP
jgi:UDP-2,3-diacylglucosamine hydrolase